MRGKSVAKSFSYALGASVATAVVASILLLVLPKFLGIEQFAYWQLYLFYVTYVGVLHFGWADGIYLRYGGKYYVQLDRTSMNAQFWLLAILETLIMLAIISWGVFFSEDPNRGMIVAFAGVNCLLLNTRAFLQFTLQGTGRIKEFAGNVVMEKSLFLLLVLAGLFFGAREFQYFLVADVIAKFVMLILLMIVCRDIVFRHPQNINLHIKESINNISSGSKLLLASVASLLIIGVFRLAIEYKWDLVTFGGVSLVLSVTSLLMILINAASVAIFPAIKRSESGSQKRIYKMLRTIIMVISLGFLTLYYPMYLILNAWLPEYGPALLYLSILLPLCIYETKNQFLINTYMKAHRKERQMMIVNIISLIAAGIVVILTAFVIHNLTLVLLGLLVTVAFRATLSELILQKTINVNSTRDILYELALVIAFLVSSSLVDGWFGFAVYLFIYLIYVYIKKDQICGSIRLIMDRRK